MIEADKNNNVSFDFSELKEIVKQVRLAEKVSK